MCVTEYTPQLFVWEHINRMIRLPPDGPDCRDANRGRLSNMEAADSCLEELLDQLR